jgi:two-component system OmpR family sensor kinase
MTAAQLLPPEPEPKRRRRGLGPRSLTARLITGVVGLVVVLVLIVGIGTYFALRTFLIDRLDQQVRSTAAQNATYFNACIEQLSAPPPFGVPRCDYNGPPLTQNEWVSVLKPTGAVFVQLSGDYVMPLRLSEVQAQAIAQNPTHALTVVSGSTELRITGHAMPRGDFVLVTGLSTWDLHHTLGHLLLLELLIGAVAVVVAFFATAYGVRFSLRNLRRVTTTANEVAAELSPTGAGLERRVDVPDDGTEVGQLAESMNTLLAAVETQFAARLQSEHLLRQFLADASHELRTPLTSIRGYAELSRMQRMAGGSADDNLARIESEGTRMSRLVEDLLMLARGDQSSLPRQELVDVSELLEDAVAGARAAFPNRPIDMQFAAGLHVVGDPDQLYRIVRNLIGNADMHTAPGRPVLVRSVADGANVLIQVIDGGPGLPPEEAAHVFERFWRADKARSRANGGTGLGLSIVAAIVAAHGGTVRFDSSVEHGSTVTVRLPAIAA